MLARTHGVKKTKPPRRVTPAKPKSSSGSTTKRTFDLSRDSIYVADPATELRICGGRGILPPDEAGELDTEPGPDIPVHDQRRLEKPVPPQTLASVHRDGVLQPVVIAKVDDVATVVAGKRRVRAARASNLRRAKEGRPLIRVRCVILRDASSLTIKGAIIRENSHREDDDLADKIEKLRAYLADGGSEQDAATEFCVQLATVRDWLDYDDHATDAVKQAVQDGKIPASTAMELAKVHDADRQRTLLDRVLATPGRKQRSARRARAIARGEDQRPVVVGRRDQRELLRAVSRERDSAASDRRDYWRGVEHALVVVTGATNAGEIGDELRIVVERIRTKTPSEGEQE